MFRHCCHLLWWCPSACEKYHRRGRWVEFQKFEERISFEVRFVDFRHCGISEQKMMFNVLRNKLWLALLIYQFQIFPARDGFHLPDDAVPRGEVIFKRLSLPCPDFRTINLMCNAPCVNVAWDHYCHPLGWLQQLSALHPVSISSTIRLRTPGTLVHCCVVAWLRNLDITLTIRDLKAFGSPLLYKYDLQHHLRQEEWFWNFQDEQEKIEVFSNCRKITLTPVLSKLVFLYYIFSSLEPLQLAGPSACVRSPASWRGSGLEKSY